MKKSKVPEIFSEQLKHNLENVVLFDDWQDTIMIDPNTINNGVFVLRDLDFVNKHTNVVFPRNWKFFTMNNFWSRGCKGEIDVHPSCDYPSFNILRLASVKPIRIFSSWINYNASSRFRLNLVARAGNEVNAELLVSLQDFIKSGSYQPVHELLLLPLKSGNFFFYTTEFDCKNLAGGKRFNLTLDLHYGVAEILFLCLERI